LFDKSAGTRENRAVETMSNDRRPAHIRGLKFGAQAMGALAAGALAMGALAIGALAMGRLVIGRSRIRRLEIDELVVGRLHVTDSLTPPSTLGVKDQVRKQESERFDQPTTLDRAINKLFGPFRWAGARSTRRPGKARDPEVLSG
jgi:hypothetical protein